MTAICFHFDPNLMVREYWSYVFSNFGISKVYEVGRPDDIDSNYYDPVVIDSLADLPGNKTLVIAAHQNAKYIQGTVPLPEFEHPASPIYIFGGDNGNLYPELLGNRNYKAVYIPGDKIEMYSFQAAAIFMYDRMVKHG